MITDKKISYNIISVLKLHWDRGSAEATDRAYHALSIRLDGEAEFECGDERYTVSRGDIIYVPKGRNYRITSKKSESVIVVHFDIADNEDRDFEVITPASPEIMTDLFIKMHSAWEHKRIGYEYRVESLFARVMEGLVAEAFNRKHGIRIDLSTLLDFIHTNFNDPSISVASLAKRISVSPTYLRRLFNEKFGVSPIKYLTRLRIDHARALLESGYYTVEAVSRMCGFNDPKYFSTAYKRHVGISPRGSVARSSPKPDNT